MHLLRRHKTYATLESDATDDSVDERQFKVVLSETVKSIRFASLRDGREGSAGTKLLRRLQVANGASYFSKSASKKVGVFIGLNMLFSGSQSYNLCCCRLKRSAVPHRTVVL